MALNICLEAFIRLFFEIIRFLFGDVSLIFRSSFFAYLEVGLPVMISRLWLIFIFVVIILVFRQPFMRNLVILSIPAAMNSFSDFMNILPTGISQIIGIPIAFLGIFVSAIAWGFLVLSNEKIHPLLRISAAPIMMILGAANAAQPVSIVGDAIAFLGFTYMAEIAAFAMFIIMGLIVLASPTFICSAVNKVLMVISGYRYEGVVGAWSTIWSCLIFIPKKVFSR